MKKLSIILAALVLVLLCGCAADPAPAQDLDEAEPAAAEPVRVATFTADILSAGGDTLMVAPEPGSFADASANSVAVQLAEGLVPTGADGWPIAVSELLPELCVDITYLGDPTPRCAGRGRDPGAARPDSGAAGRTAAGGAGL